MACTIIAEAGVNHDGKLDKALRLCDAAKAAGADIVKFQTYLPDFSIRKGKDYDLLVKLALPLEDFCRISEHCKEIDIEFCSTPDDLISLMFLVEHCGVKRIKLGSGSLLYRPLVDAVFDTGLPVLLSTGMATIRDICDGATPWLRSVVRLRELTVMHCVSLYPCPPHLANVAAVATLKNAYGWQVGYSDHTIGDYAALAAVALGATVIEKHFTLDNEDDGPDHRMSATPDQFERLVMKVRMVETVLGDGRKEPSPEERAMIPRIRKDAEGFQPGL